MRGSPCSPPKTQATHPSATPRACDILSCAALNGHIRRGGPTSKRVTRHSPQPRLACMGGRGGRLLAFSGKRAFVRGSRGEKAAVETNLDIKTKRSAAVLPAVLSPGNATPFREPRPGLSNLCLSVVESVRGHQVHRPHRGPPLEPQKHPHLWPWPLHASACLPGWNEMTVCQAAVDVWRLYFCSLKLGLDLSLYKPYVCLVCRCWQNYTF